MCTPVGIDTSPGILGVLEYFSAFWADSWGFVHFSSYSEEKSMYPNASFCAPIMAGRMAKYVNPGRMNKRAARIMIK